MKASLLVAFALGIGLSSPAFADANPSDNTKPRTGANERTGGQALPEKWAGPISDTFFTDASGSTMRSGDEVKSRWGALSADQQAQVRSDCRDMTTTGSVDKTHPKTGADSERTGGAASACDWVGQQK